MKFNSISGEAMRNSTCESTMRANFFSLPHKNVTRQSLDPFLLPMFIRFFLKKKIKIKTKVVYVKVGGGCLAANSLLAVFYVLEFENRSLPVYVCTAMGRIEGQSRYKRARNHNSS
jgi:hypothetical protein